MSSAAWYTKRLSKRGFKKLGSGYFSEVWAKPGSSKVVKVCHNSTEQDAYPLFVEWAMKNPSPYLPTVYSFRRHKNFYVVVLDRLESTLGDMGVDMDSQGLRTATEHFASYAHGRRNENPVQAAMDTAVFSMFPGFRGVLDGFKAEFKGRAQIDMHAGNWMVTKDGQLVMTDPVARFESPEAEDRAGKVVRLRSSRHALAA